MYAITEAIVVAGGTTSRDQYYGDWWTGKGWSPASNEAKTFDDRDDAVAEMDAECDRHCRIVEIDEA